jgi:hypothetical protein
MKGLEGVKIQFMRSRRPVYGKALTVTPNDHKAKLNMGGSDVKKIKVSSRFHVSNSNHFKLSATDGPSA